VDEAARYLERALTARHGVAAAPAADAPLLELAQGEPPPSVGNLMGAYLERARLLGRRTAELHLSLASGEDPAFAPEPFSPFYQRSLYQSQRNLTARVFQLLRERAPGLPGDVAAEATELLEREGEVLGVFRQVMERKVSGLRMRCHGDFHLGQVLYTGRDFAIIDFEGEPARSLSERRLKRSPLLDVAGMLRSFQYAVSTALTGDRAAGALRPEDVPALEPWAGLWQRWAGAAFLRAYFDVAGEAAFLPATAEERQLLLDALLLEKSVYELGYEIGNRPGWVWIPLRGIVEVLGSPALR
jgi:maltose alpha-D-glucosyltransferase/alpha-amylase